LHPRVGAGKDRRAVIQHAHVHGADAVLGPAFSLPWRPHAASAATPSAVSAKTEAMQQRRVHCPLQRGTKSG
jgi:hypothetical protein